MIGIGTPSSQRRIGIFVSSGWLLALGKWDPLRFAQQVELSILSKLALITAFCIDATLWRPRNAIGYSAVPCPSWLAALTRNGARTCSGAVTWSHDDDVARCFRRAWSIAAIARCEVA